MQCSESSPSLLHARQAPNQQSHNPALVISFQKLLGLNVCSTVSIPISFFIFSISVSTVKDSSRLGHFILESLHVSCQIILQLMTKASVCFDLVMFASPLLPSSPLPSPPLSSSLLPPPYAPKMCKCLSQGIWWSLVYHCDSILLQHKS